MVYTRGMPKLWDKTIEAHRREVRDAILDATVELATEHGPLSVTMSQIAEETGVGRATLYKYFSNVESILFAWHERQVGDHLKQLFEIHTQPGDPSKHLEAVLEFYALIQYEHHDTELASLVHRADHVNDAYSQLHAFIRNLLTQAAAMGEIRSDVGSSELASYCLSAVTPMEKLPSKAAVHRLVQIVLAGLRPDLTGL